MHQRAISHRWLIRSHPQRSPARESYLDIQAKYAGCSQKLQCFVAEKSSREAKSKKERKEASHVSSKVNREKKKKKAEQT